MLNEPPPGERSRRPHPLEQRPRPAPSAPGDQPSRQQMTLHLPTVPPTVTYTLLAINIVIFVVRALSPQLNEQLLVWGASNSRDVLLNGEYHRLFTAMFLHLGVIAPNGQYVLQNAVHLLFNMFALYNIGASMERVFGHARFALIYLLGGVAGSILSVVLSPPSVYSVGASGAVFAILGGEFAYLYQHRTLFGARARAQMSGLIWIALLNFGIGILSGFGGAVRIDNWGHLGGLLGGLALTWFIGPIFVVKRHPDFPNDSQHMMGVDINPLARRMWVVSLYISALLAILIFASALVRR